MPVVVAVDGIVELGILCLLLCFLILRYGWVATFGKLITLIAGPIAAVNFHVGAFGHGVNIGFGWLSDLLLGVNHQALRLLGAGILATQYAGHKLWQWTAYVVVQTGRVIGDLADDTYRTLQVMWRDSIPGYVTARLHPLASKVQWLIHRLQHIDVNPTSIITRTVRVVDPRVKALEARVAQLAHAVEAAGAVVVNPPIAIPVPHIPGIRTGLDAVRGQVGRIVRTLTPAGIIGLTAAALFRLRLGFLKCSNFRRAGEHACRMDTDLLNGLLAETLLIFGTVSLVDAARDMQAIVAPLSESVLHFWRAD
jgi:hypothetical protein